jgi:flagellar motility protein MotE (MotC chaperone)
VQERVQEAETNGNSGEEKAKAGPTKPNRQSGRQARGKSGRFERQNGAEVDTDLSPRTLLTRLEQQSGQLGILRSKLDETRKLAAREREAAQAAQQALEEERRNRVALEGTLKRERSARQQAEEALEDSRATASALEAQHHLLRAQLKAHEHKRRGLLRRSR